MNTGFLEEVDTPEGTGLFIAYTEKGGIHVSLREKVIQKNGESIRSGRITNKSFSKRELINAGICPLCLIFHNHE